MLLHCRYPEWIKEKHDRLSDISNPRQKCQVLCDTGLKSLNIILMTRSMSDHWARKGDVKLTRYAIHKTELL
jgi:hypothetical protein